MSQTDSTIIETDIPARLDRLPWGRFHWLVVLALGITWVLDGLEVTLAGMPGLKSTYSKSLFGLSHLRNVFQYGFSYDKARQEVINRLQTGDGERVFLIEAADGDYRLTPYDPGFEKKMAKAEEIMGRYRNTLHALAK